MLFYRVETKDNKGPYTHGGLQNIIIDNAYYGNIDIYYKEYLPTHPTPANDDLLSSIGFVLKKK